MNVRLVDLNGVEFEVRTLALERRPPQPLLTTGRGLPGELLRMCSWCKKMPDGGGRMKIEEAVAKMRLFEEEALPHISHGICAERLMTMRKTVKGAGPAA
jgi:hypothetical protein